MAQTFYPYRFAFALVLSVILVLSVTQLAQAKTAQRPTYPTQTEAKDAIAYYYNFLGAFHDKNFLYSIDSITYGPLYGTSIWERFGACTQYQFAPKTSPHAKQTARHIFTFQYDPGRFPTHPWTVIDMDVNAC